jgi:hypothetical protein
VGGATLLPGLILPWLTGMVLVTVALRGRRSLAPPGELAWIAGAGYLVGALILTLWMRALSILGIRYGVVSIAIPLAALAAAAGFLLWRRDRDDLQRAARVAFEAIPFPPDLRGTARMAWRLLLAWIALRFVLLGLYVAWQPLYPWEAWTQWATKARVWYELGHLVPFVGSKAWFEAGGAFYFDAAPGSPPTLPLLQVWACIALGRWDDALMNWPWWQMAAALTLSVYGALRGLGMPALAALVAAYLVASIPLLDLHVALAGYADLPMSAYYTCAALALMRWAANRDSRDAAMLVVMAFACTQLCPPGFVWTMTLVPGVVVALAPRVGLKMAAAGLGVLLLLLAVLAQTEFEFLDWSWHLDFRPAWSTLSEGYLLLGNWNLLWYGVPVAALLAGRQLASPRLAPLTMVAASGAVFLFVIFAFPDVGRAITGSMTFSRATLHYAPLATVFAALAFHAFTANWNVRIGAADLPRP